MKSTDLSGRVSLITGAAGNLGRAVAETFHSAGSRTILVDHREERIREIFSNRIDSPNHLAIGGVDLTSPDEVASLFRRSVEKFGRVDILVNTVGAYAAGKPVHEEDWNTWEKMWAVNVRTAVNCCRAAVPLMMKEKWGRIVTIGSRNALEGASGKDSAYSASKTAVLRLTESLAEELKGRGITANCILPGTIDTPENRKSMPDADISKWVKPEKIAEMIAFLATDRASAITGAAIPVYGAS
jgi:NAD(P)-dependent dehydrogenase (short-subunit alcohol dehydrogenase family)